jgi:hypothetical protein
MCISLFIGSENELFKIAFNDSSPSFHTSELKEEERLAYNHISFSNILYVGSHEGCGCGFRHALLDNGQWYATEPEEISISEEQAFKKNHENLYLYINRYLSSSSYVEIYVCWEGDLVKSLQLVEEITSNDLLNSDFYFKERTLYRIRNSS